MPLRSKPFRSWLSKHLNILEGEGKYAIEIARERILFAGFICILCFLAIAFRLVELSLESASNQPHSSVKKQQELPLSLRGNIYDREGMLIATNLSTPSLYADPKKILDVKEAVDGLKSIFPELEREELWKMLTEDRRYVWIKRNITPEQQYQVNRLGIPGFGFVMEEKRLYPYGSLFAHLLGMVGIDGTGLLGLEKTLDKQLNSNTGEASIELTVDMRIQGAVHQALTAAKEEFQAIGAAGIVMDVTNGEIVAMVNLPDFDPNVASQLSPATMFNKNTLGVYEMGSTFKAFNTAIALDSGLVKITDKFDATKSLKVGRFSIDDFHPERRVMNVAEVFMHSSNIGSALMAIEFGAKLQKEYFQKFGLLSKVPFELPERSNPMVPKQWSKITSMTVSFGHGIAVSPLHVVAAAASLVNGGIYHEPTVFKSDTPREGKRVVSKETSDLMRGLFRLVITSGTATKAEVPGYLVGGKTGTAEKAQVGGYNRKALLTSFIGFFPMNEPRYAVLVMMDEPKGNKSTFGYATAGYTAAPVAANIINQMVLILGMQPTDTEDPRIQAFFDPEHWIPLQIKEKKE